MTLTEILALEKDLRDRWSQERAAAVNALRQAEKDRRWIRGIVARIRHEVTELDPRDHEALGAWLSDLDDYLTDIETPAPPRFP